MTLVIKTMCCKEQLYVRRKVCTNYPQDVHRDIREDHLHERKIPSCDAL